MFTLYSHSLFLATGAVPSNLLQASSDHIPTVTLPGTSHPFGARPEEGLAPSGLAPVLIAVSGNRPFGARAPVLVAASGKT